MSVDLLDIIGKSVNRLVIVGTNPLAPTLERSADLLADLLTGNDTLTITILCESDSENFSQSLMLDIQASPERAAYSSLQIHRNRILGSVKGDGLEREIGAALLARASNGAGKIDRVFIRQLNLRLPVNLVIVDEDVWMSISTIDLPTFSSYTLVTDMQLNARLLDLIDFYLDPKRGGLYLSTANEELIQLYDNYGFPRGIFPRSCFYNTAYQRQVIWGFIFNRKGKLLLHRRSHSAKDGRGLWDKSVGGHVDLRDSSTFITAQRELVEELFLPEAEFSKYIRADLGDIINFGDWNLQKRPERMFRDSLNSLGDYDWVMFRATANGDPMTISRISSRRVIDARGDVSIRKTRFISDVYLFVAPEGLLDTDEQMRKLLAVAEAGGAASDHRLITLAELRGWIDEAERSGVAEEVFTDDLLYIVSDWTPLLEEFGEFVVHMSR